MGKWKDMVPDGFDLDDILARCPGVTESTMRQRLKRCNFNTDLACNNSYWEKNMKRGKKRIRLRGKKYSMTTLAKLLGVSPPLISRWFSRVNNVDKVVKGIMYGHCGPNIYQEKAEGPPDWSSLDVGPRIRLSSLSHLNPTVYDWKYGNGPINEMDTKI